MLLNIFKVAIKALFTNKTRSFLTMLGVIIGVGSVVMLTAIGTGLQAYVTEQFDELGASNVIVLPGDIFGEGGGFSQESSVTSIASSKLRFRDMEEVAKIREYVEEVTAFNFTNDTASYRGEEEYVTVMGTTPEYEFVLNTPAAKGRFFTETENDGGDRVALLGYEVANEIFGNVDPIGKSIQLGGTSYKVVGVAEEKGSSFGGPSFDTYIYIPLQTYFRQYDTSTIIRIIAQTKDKNRIEEAINAIEDRLLKRLEDDEFSVIDQSEILDTINQILNVLTVGLGGIASISLLVGGIGIMNIMLVSVTERTREIGLRKALGATPNIILLQFLIEAALISVLGGLLGLALAFIGVQAMQPFFPAKVTSEAIALAFGVSTAIGLIFGAAPARRASRLSPIEALRYE